MESAWLIRPLSLTHVVVALPTDAVVQAYLDTPLHLENFRALLFVQPAFPLPIRIRLGDYSIERRAYLDCEADIPDLRTTIPSRKRLRTAYRRAQVPPA